MTVILWLRRDLRLHDNPAVAAAMATGQPVLPVHVRDDEDAGGHAPGGASRWWLHGSLESLAADFEARGNRLVLRTGPAAQVLAQLAAEVGARQVVWTRRYEPWALVQAASVRDRLQAAGASCREGGGGLLHDPAELRTGSGGPYRVFSPFWRALRERLRLPPEAAAPAHIPPAAKVTSEDLTDWGLRPTRPDWAGGLRDAWRPGEAGAASQLARFLDDGLSGYRTQRDIPGRDGTSRLSPHLHFGEIGPAQIWRAVAGRAMADFGDPWGGGAESFLSEIAWREFSQHLLAAFPDLPDKPLRPEFGAMPWRDAPDELAAWTRGRTGFPIVDAGMRQLWRTGWMHNRVRMIVASFLVKDLLIPWQAGEAWFWDTLVDADLASNAASWQWVAGSGADAAPYFRVFNPVSQGRKFDPDGAYVRRWVPELAGLSDAFIHEPWAASPIERAAAGVTLGLDYPNPIVDHAAARVRALAALETSRNTAGAESQD
ncbi:deoxyribodipyrimidine photo-lyase [Phenylobacterium sp.]|uniref:cryptochrome/photolyase family protein n=1 Tax=Phenylobacterium sp. TaxID=1871053 RepID=UPI0025D321D7|nr:deoxyribodipyrimidine photo-lyase [Phenylobacterium sp.]